MNARREGFTLVEVVVAIIMLGIILTTLAGLTWATARQAVRNNRYSSMPYADISALTGSTTCSMVGSSNNTYQRCVTVTAATRGLQVQVVTTPQQRGLPATSTQFMRATPAIPNPLCIGC
jgi:prepilin-type N-terminal cleavage/methylation domain-containing protein